MNINEVKSKADKLKLVAGTYIFDGNLWIDFDTEDEYEVDFILYELQDICGNEYHFSSGSVADFSEDRYEDIDEAVRDMRQVVVEPLEKYKKRNRYR